MNRQRVVALGFTILLLGFWFSGMTLAWEPEGFLLGDPATRAVYLRVNGRACLVPDVRTLETFGFSLGDVRWLTHYAISGLAKGPNLLPCRPGDLLRSDEDGELALLWQGAIRLGEEQAIAWGWDVARAKDVPQGLFDRLPEGADLMSVGAGTIVRCAQEGCLYLLAEGKHWVADEGLLQLGGWDPEAVVELDEKLLAQIPDGDILPSLYAGCLLGSDEPGDERLYVLHKGKHLIPDAATFDAYGWQASSVLRLSPALLDAIPAGKPLAAVEKGDNLFAYGNWGQCTWYVAERRIAPSWRSAKYWFEDAVSGGYAVGQEPLPGAVLVYDSGQGRGIYGHVAYVEAVYADGSFMRADANICGWDCVRKRVSTLSQEVGVLGFVYWRYED